MKIVGIDYGRRKIGLAVGDTDNKFAEPLMVVRVESEEKAIKKVSEVSNVSRVSKVVIGISEGKTAEETKDFGRKLQEEIKLPVLYFDETLSTHDAIELSIAGGMKRKKRKNMEDAYAAAIMLQNYMENLSKNNNL